ncbi:hypothetical protein RHMOL_Rhmol07G0002400 [Rhododendron molle]|uniref:Uncharacterized protein n=1 Tax=Rhododendron molle TaxID=49168 RepID=A0ACC0MXA6_RHOML|nr:hypothetical protein RHMOL_Rhmol07G0002400 [Rhododendron molle]
MQRFDSITINHIFHKANKCADALASDTSISVGKIFYNLYIPHCIINLLYGGDSIGVEHPRDGFVRFAFLGILILIVDKKRNRVMIREG